MDIIKAHQNFFTEVISQDMERELKPLGTLDPQAEWPSSCSVRYASK